MQIVRDKTSHLEKHRPPSARPKRRIVRPQLQIVEDMSHQKHRPPSARPNLSHRTKMKTDSYQQQGYNTWSHTMSLMQEAMLTCINITKPDFKLSAKTMANLKLPIMWLCKMANAMLSENGELLQYCHLIANSRIRATWTHLYRNELGWLAQGMPGRVKGTDTIFFIPRHMVLKERICDVTHGLITCLIWPEKVKIQTEHG